MTAAVGLAWSGGKAAAHGVGGDRPVGHLARRAREWAKAVEVLGGDGGKRWGMTCGCSIPSPLMRGSSPLTWTWINAFLHAGPLERTLPLGGAGRLEVVGI
uniref:Uncharacterized protein n=1 Tax=Oryza sativa subsp. japonica TaxID=39947 RepID=Q6Z1P5_ORYSJ|nr:hypothetical protein [Oryza sativa Japonica Group]